MIEYINFEIDINRVKDGSYEAVARLGEYAPAFVRFGLPLDEQALDQFMGRVGGLRDATPYHSQDEIPLRTEIMAFGDRLFQILIKNGIKTLYDICIATAEDENKRIRIYLHLQHSDLVHIPWEFLFDASRQEFLIESHSSPVIRYVSRPGVYATLNNIKLPLNIVVLISSPQHPHLHQLDVEQEWQNFSRDLQELVDRQIVKINKVSKQPGESQYTALQRVLRAGETKDCHIFHYIGHGGHTKEGNVLVWEDGDGKAHFVKAYQVATLLGNAEHLRLVVLNSCDGARATATDPFAGVAQKLVSQKIPSVVAMQFKITDRAAISFSRDFYRSLLVDSMPVLAAMTEARKAIIGEDNDIEWLTPVVYTHLKKPNFIDVFPPYKGLDSFQIKDAGLFFGRDELIHGDLFNDEGAKQDGTLIKRIRKEWLKKRGGAWRRMLIITGASGSGKSSLVKAGLLPKFQDEGWTIYQMTPDKHPLVELSSLIGLSNANDLFKSDTQTMSKSLGQTSPQGKPVILLVDQFEELFTLCKDEEERKAFIDNLMTAVRDPDSVLHVIITMRIDYLRDCLPYEQLRDAIGKQQELIGGIDENALRAMIVLPIEGKYQFEAGLVDQIIKDCQEGIKVEPGILPFLSLMLLKLWEGRSGRTFTWETYNNYENKDDKYGGVIGTIAKTAETVYKRLGNNDLTESEAQKVCRLIFISLVNPAPTDNSGLDTRRRVSRRELIGSTDELSSIKEDVLQSLIEARLIRSNRNDKTGDEYIEVAHEALIRTWDRLARWINDDRSNLLLLGELNSAAEKWEQSGRDRAYLNIPGQSPVQIRKQLQNRQIGIASLADQFLTAWEKEEKRQQRSRLTFITLTICLIGGILAYATIEYRKWKVEEETKIQEEKKINTLIDKARGDDEQWIEIISGTLLMPEPISVNGFEIGKYEVTIEQYCAHEEAFPNTDGQHASCISIAGREKYPITDITATRAYKFCNGIGGRLPTVTEWEYVVRGAEENRRWPWGNGLIKPHLAHLTFMNEDIDPDETKPVDTYIDGATKQTEIHQLIGNVQEWTLTEVGDRYSSVHWDGISEKTLYLVGGSFYHHAIDLIGIGITFEITLEHDKKGDGDTGFRCVRMNE